MRNGIRHWFAYTVFILLILTLVGLIFKIAYINCTVGPKLRRYAEKQYKSYRPKLAIRGTIYDRRGKILAGTKIVPSLFADPFIIEDKIGVADILSAIIGEDSEKIYNILINKPNARFVWIKRNIEPKLAESIKKLPIRGVGIIEEPVRFYPCGKLAGHILGSVDRSGRGIEGIELYYDKLLRGINGKEVYIKDAGGRKIWLIKSECKPAINGKHIILSVDGIIQQFTQEVLRETVEHFRAESGIAIVMDPRNGDILALAVVPEVDPNRFGKFDVSVRRNRAITDPFEPGSVFKPFIAAIALEAGVVKWNEKIYCHQGAYKIGRRILHDYHPYGYLSFPEIVIHSSNIGMAILGQRLGNKRLYQIVRKFGFGEKTGIDLPGEDEGIIRALTKWNDYSTVSIPMGQEIAVTGIQLITAFASIANDGILLKPRLLRGCIDENGKIIDKRLEPIIVRRVLRKEIAKDMVEKVLRGVVSEGTGRRAELKGYMIFGKTGTAQIPRRDGRGYEEGGYVASFVGGGPANNPKVVVLVSIRRPDPKIGHFGGTVSAPAVKKILEKCFKYWHIEPIETEEPKERIKIKPDR